MFSTMFGLHDWVYCTRDWNQVWVQDHIFMVLVFSWTQEHLDYVLIQTWPSARLKLNPLLVLNQTLPFSGLRLDSDLTWSWFGLNPPLVLVLSLTQTFSGLILDSDPTIFYSGLRLELNGLAITPQIYMKTKDWTFNCTSLCWFYKNIIWTNELHFGSQ